LSLFAGVAVAHSRSRVWTLAVVALLLASAVIWDVPRIGDARTQLASDRAVENDLHALVDDPSAAEALRRSPMIRLQNPRTLPLVAYWAGRPADAFAIGGAPAIAARSPAAETYLVGRPGTLPPLPPGPAITNGSWALYDTGS
jgi:hypothetical protein